MAKLKSITKLLLENNTNKEIIWPGLKKGKPASKMAANRFMLGSILNYQIAADTAWDNAKRLVKVLNNPDSLWNCITAISEQEWEAKWKEYSLHRFPKAHKRVWKIGYEIVTNYDGDVRKIWKAKTPDVVLTRLYDMRVGEQISRMIVGALIDTEQIKGRGDVKVDIHVRRVLGRVLRGEGYSIKESHFVLEKTREMYQENPWLLDKSLYMLGKELCLASNPKCTTCYLQKKCEYNKNISN